MTRGLWAVLALMATSVGAQEMPAGKVLDAEARAECEAAGGYVGQGIGPDELCIRPTGDAGKTCTTNADCESFCLAETATCGEWTPLFGCHEVLVGEGQSVTICVD